MVLGIDEVGRGSLAGPLTVAAVSLNSSILGLKDSKKLSLKQRGILAEAIYLNAVDLAIGWVWPHEIDKLGMTQSMRLAIKRALLQLKIIPQTIIIDGNFNYLPDYKNATSVIKADDTIKEVSAASILAKVARDNYMKSIDYFLPSYDFVNNVGYGTKKHLDALYKVGLSPIHRRSFKPCNVLLDTL
jgi:ribonuclease HII